MAEQLAGDTQMAESINSCIKLICTRCPKIDLSTLSARITIKKSISVTSKKWSAVKSVALPLLEELDSFGDNSRSVHIDGSRFQGLVEAVSWDSMSPSLTNTDLSMVMPSLKPTPSFQWVAAASRRVRSALSSVESPCMSVPLCLVLGLFDNRDERDFDGGQWSFFHLSTTLRAQAVLAEMQLNDAGHLFLKDASSLTFTTLADLFGKYYEPCNGPEKVKIKIFALPCMPVDDASGRRFVALASKPDDPGSFKQFDRILDALHDDDGFLCEPLDSLRKAKAAKQKSHNNAPLLGSGAQDVVGDVSDDDDPSDNPNMFELQDWMDVNAGYGFNPDDDFEQTLEPELSETQAASMDAKTLKRAEDMCQAASGSRKVSLRSIDTSKAVDHLETMSGATSSIGLTAEEIEEEAVLLLVQEAGGAAAASSSSKAGGSELQPPKPSGHADSALALALADNLAAFEAFSSGGDSDAAADVEDEDDAVSSEKKQKTEQGPHVKNTKAKAKIEKAKGHWTDRVSFTLRSILDASARCQQPLGTGQELALVARLPAQGSNLDRQGEADTNVIELHFVKWASPDEWQGRTVRVVDSRVVWAPTVMFGKPVPVELFSPPQHQVLINCVGACSRRQKAELRDQLPDKVQRFFSFVGVCATFANKEPSVCLRGLVSLVFLFLLGLRPKVMLLYNHLTIDNLTTLPWYSLRLWDSETVHPLRPSDQIFTYPPAILCRGWLEMNQCRTSINPVLRGLGVVGQSHCRYRYQSLSCFP